jgi:hypothetical protein
MPSKKTTAPEWLEALVKRGLEILQKPGNRDESRSDPRQRFDRLAPGFLEELPDLLEDLKRIGKQKSPSVAEPTRVQIIVPRGELIRHGFERAGVALVMGDGVIHRQYAMVTPAAIWSHPDLRDRYKRCSFCGEFFLIDKKAPRRRNGKPIRKFTCSDECRRLAKK